MLIQPSSAAAERVFFLLNNLFSIKQYPHPHMPLFSMHARERGGTWYAKSCVPSLKAKDGKGWLSRIGERSLRWVDVICLTQSLMPNYRAATCLLLSSYLQLPKCASEIFVTRCTWLCVPCSPSFSRVRWKDQGTWGRGYQTIQLTRRLHRMLITSSVQQALILNSICHAHYNVSHVIQTRVLTIIILSSIMCITINHKSVWCWELEKSIIGVFDQHDVCVPRQWRSQGMAECGSCHTNLHKITR